jgi:hypothetical protein
MEHEILLGAAGLALTTGGAAWAGVKLSLNGMRATVNRIDKTVERINGQVQINRADIASIQSRCVAYHQNAPYRPIDSEHL